MKTDVSPELLAHLAQEVTTISTCWRLQRPDAEVFRFTDHDEDLEVDGEIYEAASGTVPTSISHDRGLASDDMEAMGLLSSDRIKERDLASGLFDFSTISVFLVNWADPSMGVLWLAKNWTLGNITVSGESFQAEIRGISQRVDADVVEIVSETCRATLGDTRCGVELTGSLMLRDGIALSILDRKTFTAAVFQEATAGDPDFFKQGTLTWLEPESSGAGGLNAGISTEVVSADRVTGEVTLFDAMSREIQVGDEFTVTAGCDKKCNTCKDRFDNLVNFRGEPFVPAGSTVKINRGPADNSWTR